jgi:hypothetical protein
MSGLRQEFCSIASFGFTSETPIVLRPFGIDPVIRFRSQRPGANDGLGRGRVRGEARLVPSFDHPILDHLRRRHVLEHQA